MDKVVSNPKDEVFNPYTEYTIYQFVCKNTLTNNYKITRSRYKSIDEAQAARIEKSNWVVIYPFEPSCQTITETRIQKYQWIIEMEMGSGFKNKFHITGLLTEPEIFKKYGGSDNVTSYYRLEDSMVVETVENM